MSSFDVKSILHRDVVGLDQWFADSKEMCRYLRFRNDERMVYSNIDPKFVDKRRSEKKEIKIKRLYAWTPARLRAKFNKNTYERIIVWLWKLFEFGIFFVQKASCECLWDRRWFSGRVYGRWRRRSAVSYLWFCEHSILCESAFVQFQWSCIFRARGEKGSSHWEITISVWSCYSSWRIVFWCSIFAEVPFTSSKQKEIMGNESCSKYLNLA